MWFHITGMLIKSSPVFRIAFEWSKEKEMGFMCRKYNWVKSVL